MDSVNPLSLTLSLHTPVLRYSSFLLPSPTSVSHLLFLRISNMSKLFYRPTFFWRSILSHVFLYHFRIKHKCILCLIYLSQKTFPAIHLSTFSILRDSKFHFLYFKNFFSAILKFFPTIFSFFSYLGWRLLKCRRPYNIY